MRYLTSLLCSAFVLFGLLSTTPGFADVPAQCVDRFLANEAIPGTDECLTRAVSSAAGLSNFSCTVSLEVPEEYCNGPTPDCPDGTVADSDTGQCIEEQTCSDGSEPNANGVCPVFDENRGEDGACLYGLGNFQTGLCPEKKRLDDFEQTDAENGGADGCGGGSRDNPLISKPGPVLVVTGGGGLNALAVVSVVNAAAKGVNIVDSSSEAQETGDSSRLFDNIAVLTFPLLPGDNFVRSAFGDFSNFLDKLNDRDGC